MPRNIKQYSVCIKSRIYPQYGQRRILVNAPTKKWIRDNWLQIAGTPDYMIVSIDEIRMQQYAY